MQNDKIKVEIEIPAPPKGWKFYGRRLPKKGEMILCHDDKWEIVHSDFGYDVYPVAIRSQTFAEWCNEQRNFVALAELFGDMVTELSQTDGFGCIMLHIDGEDHCLEPMAPIPGKATLKDGKWVDA